MAGTHVKYLLLGGGSAAASCAAAIRRIDATGELMLVSAETSRPYHRPPLARGYLRREMRIEDLFSHPSGWYGEQHITLHTGLRALALDLPRAAVTLSDGREIHYDKLAIATGATARSLSVPGANLPGAMTLRTVEDADRIHHAADVALSVGRGQVVVVGSQMVAAEIAASLAQRRNPGGKPLVVTLVCGRRHLLEGLVGETAGAAIGKALEALDVRVICGPAVTALEGDGRVQRVALSGGESVPCDFAVIGEGWSASKDLLRGTALAAEKAILTDATGRTSVAGVYAAGECAAMFDPVFGKHRVLDHWDVTVSRGLVVGANMAGADSPWSGVTLHRAEIGKTRVLLMGEPRFTTRTVVRTSEEGTIIEVAVDREGRACAAAVVGTSDTSPEAEAMVRGRLPVG
jgi:3-phenylpropionate/trans-cinnamate dioxygenase ferredoxin reductase component